MQAQTRKRRNPLKIILRVFLIILCCLVAALLITTVTNLICTGMEKEKIEAYGQEVDLADGTMNVGIYGDGENVIVLLPGMGIPSPVIEFSYLTELLSEKYTVVIPEPFGYGLSDITDSERTAHNKAVELHECLAKLGYTSYTLMGHSLSGLTMLEYANVYPEEVEAVIAMDASVPKQISDSNSGSDSMLTLMNAVNLARVTGVLRVYSVFDKSIAGYIDSALSDETAEQLRYIMRASFINRNMIDEYICAVSADCPRMYDMKYPDEIPVLTFLAEDNVEYLSDWQPWHEEISDNENSALIVLSGGHMVYRSHPEEIAEKAAEFIESNPKTR